MSERCNFLFNTSKKENLVNAPVFFAMWALMRNRELGTYARNVGYMYSGSREASWSLILIEREF